MQRLNKATTELQNKVNQQIRQPLREDMSFLTRFINNKHVNEHILNQDYVIDSSLISNLYQPQTSISNTYVLTFLDEVVKALNKMIEHQSNPLFKEVIQHAEAKEIAANEDEDRQIYESFIELRQIRESLTTHNYQHYYIHLDDSLDKLIGRTEVNFRLKQENSTAYHQMHQQKDQENVVTTKQVDIQNALKIVEDVPLFERTKKDIQDTIQRLNQKVTKIGVFGTFSAGKSSLINALIGNQYLVSSPNPTTAATTELSYGNHSEITLKSEDQLLEEVNRVLEFYDISFNSLEEFIHSDFKKLKSQLEKNQLAFISAIEQHYKTYIDMLHQGIVHSVSQEDVKK